MLSPSLPSLLRPPHTVTALTTTTGTLSTNMLLPTPSPRTYPQVLITEEMDGMTIRLPAFTRNFYVDGHVPVPH